MSLCLWCEERAAIGLRAHALFGPSPVCETCLVPGGSGDLEARMAAHLLLAAKYGGVDLGDWRAVRASLAEVFEAGEVDRRGERALEAARRKLQRRRARRARRAAVDHAASAAAWFGLVAVWAVIYCLLCPPARAGEYRAATAAAATATAATAVAAIAAGALAPDADGFDFEPLVICSPLIVAAALVLVWLWRQGRPAPADAFEFDDASPENRFRREDGR